MGPIKQMVKSGCRIIHELRLCLPLLGNVKSIEIVSTINNKVPKLMSFTKLLCIHKFIITLILKIEQISILIVGFLNRIFQWQMFIQKCVMNSREAYVVVLYRKIYLIFTL